MENPADYDIDKDMQNEDKLDETKIGKWSTDRWETMGDVIIPFLFNR